MDDNVRLILTAALAALPPTLGVIFAYLRGRKRAETIITKVDASHSLINQRYDDLLALNAELRTRIAEFEHAAVITATRRSLLGDPVALAAAASLISQAEIRAQELLAEAARAAREMASRDPKEPTGDAR